MFTNNCWVDWLDYYQVLKTNNFSMKKIKKFSTVVDSPINDKIKSVNESITPDQFSNYDINSANQIVRPSSLNVKTY